MARVARPGRPMAYAGSDSDDSGPAPARRGRGRPPSDDSSADGEASFGAKSKRPAAKVGKGRKEGQENVPPAGVNGAKRRLSGKGVGEKRRSLAAVAASPPSTPVPANRAVSAMARPGGVAALARVREAGNGSFLGNTSGTPSRLVVSKEVMNTNYEEWMKMATDNKINAQNTWSFALIDYFHDMSLLRNSEAEGGINFQKASCTLDGCVKIWTSRVDSVAVETGKLLSGLAEDAANPAAYGDGDSDVGGGDGDEADGGRPKRQRAPRTAGSTLVDFNDKIKVKVLDLEFTVDPLFKKTSADFDEGGAAGILMNHLSIDGEMRVVFDAGDATLVDDENDDAGADDTLVDVTKLKESFLPPLDELAARSLCPSLSSFKFSTSDSAGSFDIAALKAAAADDGPVPTPAEAAGGDGDRSGDFFDGQPDFVGGGGEDFFAGAGIEDEDDEDDEHGGGTPGRGGMVLGGVEAFDPARAPHERDIVMAMQDGEAGAGMFDYFDKGFMKNWAGPEHWKLRRTIKKNDQQGSTAPRQRKEKQPFSIDFEGEPAQTRKELFATGTVSTTLPKPKAGRRSRSARGGSAETDKGRTDHTLPDDMHFNSQQLLRLFLKPKYVVNMRRRGPAPEGEVDENFWAQQAAAAQADAAAAATGEDDDGGMAIPFATQFFNDEGDDVPDFEEEYDNPVGDDLGPSSAGGGGADGVGDVAAEVDEEDLIAATKGELKRARPEFVNYAKKAKRVDVKKLKENIWRELETLTKDVERPRKDDAGAAAPASPPPPPPSEKQAFTQVLGGLRRLYPRDKMDEISTSFCFICLLHLANEKGLRIQGDATKLLQEQDEEAEEDEEDARGGQGEEGRGVAPRFVGGLEELKIFRDRAVIGPDDEDD